MSFSLLALYVGCIGFVAGVVASIFAFVMGYYVVGFVNVLLAGINLANVFSVVISEVRV